MPSYSPPWAPHVIGEYPERVIDRETGQAESQLINMSCSKCNDTHQHTCDSGAVRQWILRYASVHLHRDPFTGAPR